MAEKAVEELARWRERDEQGAEHYFDHIAVAAVYLSDIDLSDLATQCLGTMEERNPLPDVETLIRLAGGDEPASAGFRY